MQNILITGATGYVGSVVVAAFLKAGKAVTALGRRHPEADIRFLEADFTDLVALETALEEQSFDAIVHVASLPGDTGDAEQMMRVNVNGCQNMLEWARKLKVQRFVLSSSISAYEWFPATKFNPPDYLPVDENHPCRPKDMYATTKRMQELLASTYYHQFGVPTTVLRLTAVVGPRGRGGGRGWREFAEKLMERESVQVPHFSAEEVCHYIDSRDVAEMHRVACEHPAAVGEVFNCCGPAPTSGAEFAQIVQDVVPGIEVEYGFPWSMCQGGRIAFDMSKAAELIDFTPRYSLADTIRNIKDWIDAGGLQETQAGSETLGGGVQSD